MKVAWDSFSTGPEDGRHAVLLLPGGGASGASFRALTEEPALRDARLVAATLPGHAGTPPPEDFSVEHYAALAAELAAEHRCDVAVGFSMGATIVAEMVARGLHRGPAVLLGVSLSAADEPGFFRALVRISPRLGHRPVALLMRIAAAMASRQDAIAAQDRAVLSASLSRNVARDIGRSMEAYVAYLGAQDHPAERLCAAGMPLWVVHTEKGDGGLTAEERSALDDCPTAHVVTLPGSSFFLPEERPADVAAIVAEAVRAV